jgi:hypothetical protein
VIKYMLMMWKDFPGMKPVTATGIKMKESFYINATPQEFLVNGEMWTEVEVFLSAQSFMDRQGNTVEIMQLYQNELIDWDTAVDNLQQITNKKRTRARIDKDRQWKAEGMAIANSAANSAMTANVDPGAQQRTNYGLERGFMGETGAMPGPEAEASAAAPPVDMGSAIPLEQAGNVPQGNSGGEIVTVLQDFFASIGKLNGAVWFGGDPIVRPEMLSGDKWIVDVWVTDPQDKGTITRAAQNVEVIYGHLRFHTGEPSPEEKAIQVSQGSAPPSGGTPGTGAPPSPGGLAEGLPPEIARLMGSGEDMTTEQEEF